MAQSLRGYSNKWQDWINLLLGIWLFISPWVLRFYPGSSMSTPHAAWTDWVLGVIVVVFSIAAIVKAQIWEEWINLIAGVLLFISPWVFGFAAMPVVLWDALIVGALVFILSIWDMNTQANVAQRSA